LQDELNSEQKGIAKKTDSSTGCQGNLENGKSEIVDELKDAKSWHFSSHRSRSKNERKRSGLHSKKRTML